MVCVFFWSINQEIYQAIWKPKTKRLAVYKIENSSPKLMYEKKRVTDQELLKFIKEIKKCQVW